METLAHLIQKNGNISCHINATAYGELLEVSIRKQLHRCFIDIIDTFATPFGETLPEKAVAYNILQI